MRGKFRFGWQAAILAVLWVSGCAANAPAPDFQALVASADRSEADRATDGRRKPADMLAFYGVRAGMTVCDVSAGAGYNAELLARAVGGTGKVYAQTPTPNERLRERMQSPVMKNVVAVVRGFSDPVPPEVRMALRVQFGLDDPIWQRYLSWLSSMFQGNWGFSFVSRINVDQLIAQRMPVTLAVIGLSQLLAMLVALPVGILSAAKPYSWFDRIASTLAFIGFSLPTFFTGVIFILFFSIYLGWFPFVYRSDLSATGLDWWWQQFRQSIMPITVLGLFQAASMMRYVRSAVLDVIRLDYVTTARSKGLAERTVITKHVVRNALIPVVTLVALQMPAVFGGAIVTEQIFRIPGIGSLLIDAILRNDTPVIMAVTFVVSCLVILFNLIADLLYGWLDPRISYR